MSEKAKSKAILETANGISQEFDQDVNDIPESTKYTYGYMKDTTYTIYIVYELPDYNKDDANAGYAIIESTGPKVSFGFVARSIRFFNSDGIVLFEYRRFGGPEAKKFNKNCDDLTKYFPCIAQGEGISSVIIKAREWYLLTKNDGKIPVPGSGGSNYTFADGHRYDDLGVGNDQVYKLHKI